jgi:hypothetical protein
MSQKPFYVQAFYGFPGCLSDSDFGPIECATRRELVEFVTETLESVGFSGRTRRQVNLADLWKRYQFAAQPRASRFSFVVENTQPGRLDRVEFRALSKEEFAALEPA